MFNNGGSSNNNVGSNHNNKSVHIPVHAEFHTFDLLPDDILSSIFAHLNGCDIARIECTCRRWALISRRSSSNLWKDVYKHQFEMPDPAPRSDNVYWRISFRHEWWKRAWFQIAQVRDRRPYSLPPQIRSELGFLRLIGVFGLLTFLLGNMVMNLWNNQILVGWHSFSLLALWIIFCIGVLTAYRYDILSSWSQILLFAGCSSAFCSIVLFWLRTLTGPATVPIYFLLIPVIGCGLFGLAMIAVTVTFCRTPFVPASLRGSRSWLFDN